MNRYYAILLSLFALPVTAAQHEHAPHPQSSHNEHHAGHHTPIHAQHGLYMAAKGLAIFGERVHHGHGVTLDGDAGQGLGLELGYKLGHGFAIEGDASFAENTVTESHCASTHNKTESGCVLDKATAQYSTISVDVVYLIHPTPAIGTFVKTGYEYESEDINGLHVHGDDTGIAYAAGAEYAFSDHAAFLLEYEGTTIKSPRGHGVFAGVVYAF